MQNNTADTLVSDTSAFEVEMKNKKLKTHKAPVLIIFQQKLIKAGGRKIRSEGHNPINYI